MMGSMRKLTSGLRYTAVSLPHCSVLVNGTHCKAIPGKFFSIKPNEENKNVVPVEYIRNFCIIAHVDHGKSTLADRMLEITGLILKSSENKQVLDRLPVEKERGITVKAVTASLPYNYNGKEYLLNLIDTPGHVDFSNEVSRSLFACQGVILLVDANQGVQAQTVANFYSAFLMDLIIIPVLNKIDLPHADPDGVERDLESLFGFEKSSFYRISAKTGLGVNDLLNAIVEKVPPPKVSRDGPFTALIIDAWYDRFRGAILFLFISSGSVRVGDEIATYKDGNKYTVKTTAELNPEEKPVPALYAGQVGVISCNLRKISATLIGDTLHTAKQTVAPLKTFSDPKPMVFSGLYPKDQSQYDDLRAAIDKLCLNDPSVTVARETSPALGIGWRLGFLGLLHLDVFRQRLEQEFNAEAVLTAPSVTYRFKVKGEKQIKQYGGEIIDVKNPTEFPTDPTIIEDTFEPVVHATIITPEAYYQAIMEECLSRRGEHEKATALDGNRVMLTFIMPLSEIMFDFHDKLKSMSSGYASFDYEEKGYVSAPLKRLSVLINGKEVAELTTIFHVSKIRSEAKKLVARLEELIPRQQVAVVIQAALGSTILARGTIKPYRKDVAAKLYGGDVTRKTKLLKNQKEGKQKLRKFLNIEIPRDTFVDVLRGK